MKKRVLTDAEWIKPSVDSLKVNENLATLHGGISTRPSFSHAIKYCSKYPNKRYFKLLCKAILIKLGLESLKAILRSKYE